MAKESLIPEKHAYIYYIGRVIYNFDEGIKCTINDQQNLFRKENGSLAADVDRNFTGKCKNIAEAIQYRSLDREGWLG